MYTLLRSLTTRQIFAEQLPVFLTALTVAELLYKFHSFLLESIAFLATWFVFDLAATTLRRRLWPATPQERA